MAEYREELFDDTTRRASAVTASGRPSASVSAGAPCDHGAHEGDGVGLDLFTKSVQSVPRSTISGVDKLIDVARTPRLM